MSDKKPTKQVNLLRILVITAWVLGLITIIVWIVYGISYLDTKRREINRHASDVVLVAVAPDGSQLWFVKVNGTPVYFSSGGAQWTTTYGKGGVLFNRVPNTISPAP